MLHPVRVLERIGDGPAASGRALAPALTREGGRGGEKLASLGVDIGAELVESRMHRGRGGSTSKLTFRAPCRKFSTDGL
jgi:hypothetical protein